MSYRTILVYLYDKKNAKRLLETAIALAKKSDSHLIGLHVLPIYHIYSTVAIDLTAEIVEARHNALQVEAQGMKDIFEKTTKDEGMAAEWRCVEERSALVAEAVIEHGRCADLIVAGQPDPEHDDIGSSRISEQFLIEAGRPVLFIPYAGTHKNIGRNITIAWNASRESTRATFEALPFLKAADHVKILWVNPNQVNGHHVDVPGSEIATCLSRHGITAEADHSVTHLSEVGDELLSRIADSGSDLLVMGAYGHSRLREFIFGGVSRHVLQHMTVPVLMSH